VRGWTARRLWLDRSLGDPAAAAALIDHAVRIARAILVAHTIGCVGDTAFGIFRRFEITHFHFFFLSHTIIYSLVCLLFG